MSRPRGRDRAPHLWLKDGRSTLDLFGQRFVLLGFTEGPTSSFTDAAQRAGVPLEVIGIDDEKVRASYERNFVLVRPDGHVAWRGNEIPNNTNDIIEKGTR